MALGGNRDYHKRHIRVSTYMQRGILLQLGYHLQARISSARGSVEIRPPPKCLFNDNFFKYQFMIITSSNTIPTQLYYTRF